FNVTADGKSCRAEDIYEVDAESVVSPIEESGGGGDWAVARLKVNAITGKRAGDVQGWLSVSRAPVVVGRDLVLTGYGSDTGFSQKSSHGPVVFADETNYGYRVDAMPGNSGSALVDSATNMIVGIHTNGGCYNKPSSFNSGTRIAGNSELEDAIASCIGN
ncbi:MAG: trypsin-like serine peptidase, partial [Bdellovibrionota bacterium]